MQEISSCFSDNEELATEMQNHLGVLCKNFDPRDARVQSIFADKLYKIIRQLPCEEKEKIIANMTSYIS